MLTLGAAWLLGGVPVGADTVSPSQRVTSRVNIRAKPTATSAVVGKLEPGDSAKWVSDLPGWHKVRLPNGTLGYVSASWTVRRSSRPLHTVAVADVGTGLGVFVRGPDYALVYDAGSSDDVARGVDNRFVAFLKALAPDLKVIDYVVISHPHADHVDLLTDVFDRYSVRHVLDPGIVNPICGYHTLIAAIAREPGVDYRTARARAGNHTINFGVGRTCYGVELPKSVELKHGEELARDRTFALGQDAALRIMYVDGTRRQSFDENSLVIRLDLGTSRVLLTGDAGGGNGGDPANAPSPISIEGKLLAWKNGGLASDVLIVGKHGSSTSSRREFLDAVGARMFVVSAGPAPYDDETVPDQAVIDELQKRGTVLRTDFNDATCGRDPSKIGRDADGKPGGCDNIVIEINGDGEVRADYWRRAD